MDGFKYIFAGLGKQQWYKGNVMSSLVWIVCVIIFCTAIVSFSSDSIIKIVFLCLTSLSVVSFFLIFLFVFKTDPDRLQTEKFNLEQQALNINAKKELVNIKSKPLTEIKK